MRTTTTSAAAGLILLAGLLTGCGGDGEGGGEGDGGDAAPADASQEEFCDAYAGLFESMGSMDPNDTSAGIEAVQDWADDMEQVGTPEDTPDDVREGFEVVIDSVQEIDPDATEEELNDLGQDLTEGDQKSGEAFIEYANKTCPDAMKGLLGDMEDQMGDLEDELGNLEDMTESPTG
jgi:hypothetical protein